MLLTKGEDVRLLHLSDLHAKAESQADQQILADAVLRDVAKQVEARRVDLVIFTGDLSFSAREEQFQQARTVFLNPLMKLCELEPTQVILTPGNHDVDISAIDPFAEDGLRSRLKSRQAVNDFLRDPSLVAAHTKRLEPWRRFRKQFYQAGQLAQVDPLFTVHKHKIGDVRVATASISSCWRATGSSEDADRHHLVVGEHQVRTALDAVGQADLRLVAMHHPVDWLNDFDKVDVERELGKRADMLLTGHVHRAAPTALMKATGRWIHSEAGSLYQHREWPNSYSILDFELDRKEVVLNLRTYYEERDEFDAAINLLPEGRQSFSYEHGRSHLVGTVAQLRYDTPRLTADAIVEEALEDSMLARGGLLKADAGIEGVLVEPALLPMSRERYLASVDAETGHRPRRADITADIEAHACILVVGDEGDGTTSALRWLVYQRHKQDPTLAPVLVDLRHLGAGQHGIEKLVRQRVAAAGVPAGPQDPLPTVALALDNAGALNEKGRARLSAFIAAHPDWFFVVGCRPRQEDELSILLGEGCLVRYMGPFGRRQLRDLVQLIDPQRAAQIVEAVNGTVAQEHLPRNPLVLATLTSVVIADDQQITAGTQTAVLEAFVGVLLGRNEGVQINAIDLDYREREHMLGCFAERLLHDGVYGLPAVEAEAFFVDYFRRVNWTVGPSAALRDMVERRVLQERDGIIEFRQDALLYLFAAKRLLESQPFRETILVDCRRHGSVVRHAAALQRSDKELLTAVQELLHREMTEATDLGLPASGFLWQQAAVHELPADIGDEGDQVEDSHDTDEAPDQPDNTEHDEAELDEFLDDMDARASIVDHRQQWGTSQTDVGSVVRLVDLASHVLRNSELVDDLDLKRQALERTLLGWSLVIEVLSGDDDFVKTLRMAGMDLYADEDSDNDVDEVALDRFLVMVPTLFAFIGAVGSLGTEKLAPTLRDVLSRTDISAQPGLALLGASLAAIMGQKGWMEHARRLHNEHGHRKVVQEFLHWLCLRIYMTQPAGAKEGKELEDFVLDIAGSIFGLQPDRAGKAARERLRQRLRKHRVIQQQREPGGLPLGDLYGGEGGDDEDPHDVEGVSRAGPRGEVAKD